MKKLLSLVLSVLIVLSMFTIYTGGAASDGAHGYLPGDVNDDGEVTTKDVLALRRYIAGLDDYKKINPLAADVNGDGEITTQDVLKLRRYIAGLDDLAGNNEDSKYKISTLTLGGRNIARYDILIPSDADECMTFGASELQKYIFSACGIRLNIIDNPDDADGYVIEYRYDTDGGYGLGADGYHVSVDGDVTLTCGAPRGPLYVTYYFLEKFVGYRFLYHGSTYLYEAENVDTPDGFEDTEVPQFVYRTVSDTASLESDFAKLRLNAVDGNGSHYCANRQYGGGIGNVYMHGHSYAYQMAGWEHAYDQQWVTDHGLHDTQPCLTAEETFQKIIDFNVELYKERTGWGYEVGVNFTTIACSPNDNINFCSCANCKAVYAEEGSIAGTVFRLSNRVAEAQRELMPGVGVYTIAYWDARNPPKYTRPEDDVTVCFCIGGCNNHTYDHTEECAAAGGNRRLLSTAWDGSTRISTNVDDVDYYLKWCELTNNIHIWYYSCNYSYFISPSPNVLNVYNDIKFLASSGTAGVYFEGGGSSYSFEYLRNYLASRMLWDPYMSEEEFEGYLDEFLMIYYGDGWQYIKQYLYMQNRAGDLQGCWTNNFDWPWDMYNKEYFGENYDAMCSLFESASGAATDDAQREHVENLSIHMHFLGLSATYESDYVNGSAEQRAVYKTRYEWLWNYFKNRAYLEGEREDGFRATVFQNGVGGCDNFPSSSANVIDTMRWMFDYYTGQR